MELSVSEYETGMDYIALSHVLAHGRGNPHDNELPLCQVSHIFKKAAEISDPESPVHVWMDTFCVPVAPIEAREQAIVNMRDVYAKASAILILDRTLEAARDPHDNLECMLRLSICDWTTRLWTLQEGKLARSVFVQSGSGAPGHLWKMLAASPVHSSEGSRRWSAVQPGLNRLWERVENRLMDFFTDRRRPVALKLGEDSLDDEPNAHPFPPHGMNREHAIFVSNIWNILGLRETSKEDDENVCIATLLDLDVQRLLSHSGSSQKKDLLLQLVYFPAVALSYDYMTMSDEGFAWAPRYFVGNEHLLEHREYTMDW